MPGLTPPGPRFLRPAMLAGSNNLVDDTHRCVFAVAVASSLFSILLIHCLGTCHSWLLLAPAAFNSVMTYPANIKQWLDGVSVSTQLGGLRTTTLHRIPPARVCPATCSHSPQQADSSLLPEVLDYVSPLSRPLAPAIRGTHLLPLNPCTTHSF